ncbi:helix-turn-helix domain-containing protein [Chelatococcus sambhunathii]|uniref:Helix-turn-helix domain-containing protein n=1 Tax=Chelatococcus sambhunathii TaxID=363953 RepID=A0ABU1DGI1_9HYPH|nr:helix-turn-helix domain-containing protein [Chelatococcus sambhunathii]MDR4307150.1 helix-turn-helix domain-containing protein [Chelatococcus sambhunathii]
MLATLEPDMGLVRAPATRSDAFSRPSLGSTRAYRKDEEIFAEGDDADHFYRVVSGVVRTYKLLSDGRRQIDAFHLPGDIFGAEPHGVHRFTAEAVGDVSLVGYRSRSIEATALDNPALARDVLAATMESLARAQEHMLLLGRKSATEKVATFLLGLAERMTSGGVVDLPMTRIDIADHLGLTIETVSRSLTQLERQGVITLPANRRGVVLKDRAALRRLRA